MPWRALPLVLLLLAPLVQAQVPESVTLFQQCVDAGNCPTMTIQLMPGMEPTPYGGLSVCKLLGIPVAPDDPKPFTSEKPFVPDGTHLRWWGKRTDPVLKTTTAGLEPDECPEKAHAVVAYTGWDAACLGSSDGLCQPITPQVTIETYGTEKVLYFTGINRTPWKPSEKTESNTVKWLNKITAPVTEIVDKGWALLWPPFTMYPVPQRR